MKLVQMLRLLFLFMYRKSFLNAVSFLGAINEGK